MNIISNKLKEELKDLFVNGKNNYLTIMGNESANKEIDEVINSMSVYLVKELKNMQIRKNITTNKGVYFVCKNEKEISKLFMPLIEKVNSKGREIHWYNVKDLQEKIEMIGKSDILYIGKAEGQQGLKGRINQYIRYGDFNKLKARNHAGGRAIWQIENVSDLFFCWIEVEKASNVEEKLLENYKEKHNGQYPFANQKG